MAKDRSSEPPRFNALSSDYQRCLEHIHSEDNQFWRRTVVRTVFSMFEAMNSILKDKAVEAACSGDKSSHNITRIELLGDQGYRILKNGKLEVEPRRAPFLNCTAFILRCLAEEAYVDATFFADNGWNEFQKALDVRNRLTHPKQDEDLSVSDEELATVQEAVRWYYNSTITALNNPGLWTTTREGG